MYYDALHNSKDSISMIFAPPTHHPCRPSKASQSTGFNNAPGHGFRSIEVGALRHQPERVELVALAGVRHKVTGLME